MECVACGPRALLWDLWGPPLQGSDSLRAVCPTPSALGSFCWVLATGRFLALLLHGQAPATPSPLLPRLPRLAALVHRLLRLGAARLAGRSHTRVGEGPLAVPPQGRPLSRESCSAVQCGRKEQGFVSQKVRGRRWRSEGGEALGAPSPLHPAPRQPPLPSVPLGTGAAGGCFVLDPPRSPSATGSTSLAPSRRENRGPVGHREPLGPSPRCTPCPCSGPHPHTPPLAVFGSLGDSGAAPWHTGVGLEHLEAYTHGLPIRTEGRCHVDQPARPICDLP